MKYTHSICECPSPHGKNKTYTYRSTSLNKVRYSLIDVTQRPTTLNYIDAKNKWSSYKTKEDICEAISILDAVMMN